MGWILRHRKGGGHRPGPPPPIGGGCTTTVNGDYVSVNSAVAAAAVGDTICLNAGAWTWTTGQNLVLNKWLTLKGAGLGATVITDNTANVSNMIAVTEQVAGSIIIRDIGFAQGTAVHDNPNGVLHVASAGGGKPVILFRLKYAGSAGGDFCIFGSNRGLVSQCQMTGTVGRPNCTGNPSFVRHKPQTGNWGTPPTYGASDTTGQSHLYIENNTLTLVMEAIDVDDDARTVLRFNTMTNAVIVAHGNDTSSIGGRYFEAYANNFHYAPTPEIVDCDQSNPGLPAPPNMNGFLYARGGSALEWGNTIDSQDGGYWGTKAEVGLNCENLRRNAGAYPCYANQGSTLYPVPRQVGWGYSTGGTSTGGGATDCNGSPCPGGTVAADSEPVYLFANTGAGNYDAPSLFNGQENCGALQGDVSSYLVANRDYYAQAGTVQTTPTTPFNGTVKTGFGTLANRPTTCTTGVAYFATDEGSWNDGSNSLYTGQGRMYICTAPNTWTAKYGANSSGTNGFPYQYPHPLTPA